MAKPRIGLQMYTLRNLTDKDFAGTLREVAALGYEGVEFAGYGGMAADELRALLDELHLTAVGSHVGIERLESALQDEIAFLKTIGCQYAVVPWLSDSYRADADAWKRTFAKFDEFGRAFEAAGIGFGYHNHSFEFEIQVGDQFAFDAIFANTSPTAVKVEMDVCWVQNAGQDPVAYVAKYAGRLPLLHLKDMRVEGGKTLTVPLGEGTVDLDAVTAASEKAGVEWFIVEQDECQRPPLESIATSMDWLRTHNLTRA